MKAERLLRLYPRAWRERYGVEFLALLQESDIKPLDLLDILRGAARERVDDTFGRLSWVPKLLGLFAFAMLVMFVRFWISRNPEHLPQAFGVDNLLVAFTFLYFSTHVFGRMWLAWMPSLTPRPDSEKKAARTFVVVATMTAAFVAARMSTTIAIAFDGPSPVAVLFVLILGPAMPGELVIRSKRRPIIVLTQRSSQRGSFLDLGPGASA